MGCRFKAALAMEKGCSFPAPQRSFVASGLLEGFSTSWIAKAVGEKVGLVHRPIPRAVLARLSDKGPGARPRIDRMDHSIAQDPTARSHRPSRRRRSRLAFMRRRHGQDLKGEGQGGDERGSIPQLLSRLGVETVGDNTLRPDLGSAELLRMARCGWG